MSASPSPRLRWGVVSTAHIGTVAVIPAIQESTNGEVVAIASRDGERAREVADAAEIPRAYGGYAALLADADIDAVYIPLPNSLHREWTIAAVRAGKHVLCEKPLAVSAQECDAMHAAAETAGVTLMEAFMYRFHPRTDRVLGLLREGAVGPLQVIRSAFTFPLRSTDNIRLQPELGGGALMDVGCYCVNVSRTLADREPVEVLAHAVWGETGVDLRLTGVLRFPGDLIAHFDCGLTLERCETVQVAGPEGYLDVDAAFLPGVGDTVIQHHRGRDQMVSHPVPGANEYRLMVEHFADCVGRGVPVRYPPTEAAANMRVIEALYRSARNGGRPQPV